MTEFSNREAAMEYLKDLLDDGLGNDLLPKGRGYYKFTPIFQGVFRNPSRSTWEMRITDQEHLEEIAHKHLRGRGKQIAEGLQRDADQAKAQGVSREYAKNRVLFRS